MCKRTHERIRNAILMVLSDGKEHSFGYLERKVNTNWQTIRNHCKNLELFGIVSISDKGVKLMQEGRKILKRLEK